MINKNFKDWLQPANGVFTVSSEKLYVKSSSLESTAFKYDLLTKKGDEYIFKFKVKIINGVFVVKFTKNSSSGSTTYDIKTFNKSGIYEVKTVVPNGGDGTLCIHIGSPSGYLSEFELYDISHNIESFTSKLETYSKFKIRITSTGLMYKSNSYDCCNIDLEKSNYDSSENTIKLCIKRPEIPLGKRPTSILSASNENYNNSSELYYINTLSNFIDSDGDLIIQLKLIELTDNFRVGLPKNDVFISCIVF